MQKNKQIDISKNVLSLIEGGKIKMRPRWFFVLQTLLIIAGSTGLLVVSIFMFSLVTFALRNHGPMGSVRLVELLNSFPYWAIVLAVVGTGISAYLMIKYGSLYKANVTLILFGIFISIILAGWLVDYTGLDNKWILSKPMRGLYNRYRGSCSVSGQVNQNYNTPYTIKSKTNCARSNTEF